MLTKLSNCIVLLLFLTASIVFAQNESEIPISDHETTVLQGYCEALVAPFSKAGEVFAVPLGYAGKLVVDMLSPTDAASDYDTLVSYEAEIYKPNTLQAKQLAVNRISEKK